MYKRINRFIKPLYLNHYQNRIFSNSNNNGNNITPTSPSSSSQLKPIEFKSPFDQQKQQQKEEIKKENLEESKLNDDNNSGKQQEQGHSTPPPPKDGLFYKGFRLFVKTFGILNVIGLITLANVKLKLNSRNISDTFLSIDFKTNLTSEDYDLFCKKIAYQLQNKEAFYFISNCLSDEYSQIKLIESGAYQYCIDFLLNNDPTISRNKQRYDRQQEQDKEILEIDKLNPVTAIGTDILSKITKGSEEYFGFLELNKSFDFINSACEVYRIVILKTIQFNDRFNLPQIELPLELQHLKSNRYLIPKILPNIKLNSKQYLQAKKETNIRNVSVGILGTFGYMWFIRSNKRLFPKFRGNRLTNAILASLSVGVFTFLSDSNKQVYDEDLKKLIIKYVQPIIPSYKGHQFNKHLDHSWFYLSVISSIPLLIFQTKFYFILPFIVNTMVKKSVDH